MFTRPIVGAHLILMAAILGLLVLVIVDEARATTPRNFVVFKMTSSDRNYSDGSVDVRLAVRSATDMPVPDVRVVLGLCEKGQRTPFRLAARARHLKLDYEALRAFNDGWNIEWWLQSAPANTEGFTVLRLKLALPVNKGGPTFCVTGAASTPYDKAPAVFRQLVWRLS